MRTSGTRWMLVSLPLSLVAACGGGPAPTGARGPEVIERLGLKGRWALDCAADFSRQNPHMVYALPVNGLPTEQLLARDPRLDRVTPLTDIVELEGKMVQWVQKAANGTVTTIIKVEGARQKTWHALTSDGTVLVSDGAFNGGTQTPWFNKCAGG